jgi:Domain of unknown function (DUF6799)
MRNSSLTVLCAIIMAALLAGHGAAFGAEMDGIMMNHGKMMMMKDGKPAGPMPSDTTMSNGTKVMMDGTIMQQDGTKASMKDGQMMMMDGKIMEGGKATPMEHR